MSSTNNPGNPPQGVEYNIANSFNMFSFAPMMPIPSLVAPFGPNLLIDPYREQVAQAIQNPALAADVYSIMQSSSIQHLQPNINHLQTPRQSSHNLAPAPSALMAQLQSVAFKSNAPSSVFPSAQTAAPQHHGGSPAVPLAHQIAVSSSALQQPKSDKKGKRKSAESTPSKHAGAGGSNSNKKQSITMEVEQQDTDIPSLPLSSTTTAQSTLSHHHLNRHQPPAAAAGAPLESPTSPVEIEINLNAEFVEEEEEEEEQVVEVDLEWVEQGEGQEGAQGDDNGFQFMPPPPPPPPPLLPTQQQQRTPAKKEKASATSEKKLAKTRKAKDLTKPPKSKAPEADFGNGTPADERKRKRARESFGTREKREEQDAVTSMENAFANVFSSSESSGSTLSVHVLAFLLRELETFPPSIPLCRALDPSNVQKLLCCLRDHIKSYESEDELDELCVALCGCLAALKVLTASDDTPKELFMDELMDALVDCTVRTARHALVPALTASKESGKEDESGKKRAKKPAAAASTRSKGGSLTLRNPTIESINTLSHIATSISNLLGSNHRLGDTHATRLFSAFVDCFFLEGALPLQQATVVLLPMLFAAYPELREGFISDVLASVTKLSVTKEARSFRVHENKFVLALPALICYLVQSCAPLPQSTSSSVALSTPLLEKLDAEMTTVTEGAPTTISTDEILAVETAATASTTTSNRLLTEIVLANAYETARGCAATFVQGFFERLSILDKETDHLKLLDTFFDDLLVLAEFPDFPGADLLLRSAAIMFANFAGSEKTVGGGSGAGSSGGGVSTAESGSGGASGIAEERMKVIGLDILAKIAARANQHQKLYELVKIGEQVPTKAEAEALAAAEESGLVDVNAPYCFCRKPSGNKPMVKCDRCLMWLHVSCLGLPEHDVSVLDNDPNARFLCPVCSFAERVQSPQEFPTARGGSASTATLPTTAAHPSGPSPTRGGGGVPIITTTSLYVSPVRNLLLLKQQKSEDGSGELVKIEESKKAVAGVSKKAKKGKGKGKKKIESSAEEEASDEEWAEGEKQSKKGSKTQKSKQKSQSPAKSPSSAQTPPPAPTDSAESKEKIKKLTQCGASYEMIYDHLSHTSNVLSSDAIAHARQLWLCQWLNALSCDPALTLEKVNVDVRDAIIGLANIPIHDAANSIEKSEKEIKSESGHYNHHRQRSPTTTTTTAHQPTSFPTASGGGVNASTKTISLPFHPFSTAAQNFPPFPLLCIFVNRSLSALGPDVWNVVVGLCVKLVKGGASGESFGAKVCQKALKMMKEFVIMRPEILNAPVVHEVVQSMITSTMATIREACVDLVGTGIELSARHGERFRAMLFSAAKDPSVSVRKRVVCVLEAMVKREAASSSGGSTHGGVTSGDEGSNLRIAEILNHLVQRLSDEDGVKAQVMKSLTNLWFDNSTLLSSSPFDLPPSSSSSTEIPTAGGGGALTPSPEKSVKKRSSSGSASGESVGSNKSVVAKARREQALRRNVLQIVDVVALSQVNPSSLEFQLKGHWLVQLITKLVDKDKEVRGLCAGMCEALVNHMIALSGSSATEVKATNASSAPPSPARSATGSSSISTLGSQSMAYCMCALNLLSCAWPQSVEPHISTLTPYLQSTEYTSQEIVRQLCHHLSLLKRTLVRMERPSERLCQDSFTALRAMVQKATNRNLLQSAICAMCVTVAKCPSPLESHLSQFMDLLVANCTKYAAKMPAPLPQQTKTGKAPTAKQVSPQAPPGSATFAPPPPAAAAPTPTAAAVLTPQESGQLRRVLMMTGLFARYFDFDDSGFVKRVAKEVAAAGKLTLSALKPGTVCSTLHTLYHQCYFSPRTDPHIQVAVLDGLGGLLIRNPRLFVPESSEFAQREESESGGGAVVRSAESFVNHSLRSSDAALRRAMVRNFAEFLSDEEEKMDENVLKREINENADTGLSSCLAQKYLPQILECMREPARDVRMAALEVVEIILRQGLVIPSECVPDVAAAVTEHVTQLREKAVRILNVEINKHHDFVVNRLPKGAQMAVTLQTTLHKCHEIDSVRGRFGMPGADLHSYFEPLYKLVQPKRKEWQSFSTSLVDTLSKLHEAHEFDMNQIVFLTEAISFLPFNCLEEAAHIVYCCNSKLVEATGILDDLKKVLKGEKSNETVAQNSTSKKQEKKSVAATPTAKPHASSKGGDSVQSKVNAAVCMCALVLLRRFLMAGYGLQYSRHILPYNPMSSERDRVRALTFQAQSHRPTLIRTELPLPSLTQHSATLGDPSTHLAIYSLLKQLMKDDIAMDQEPATTGGGEASNGGGGSAAPPHQQQGGAQSGGRKKAATAAAAGGTKRKRATKKQESEESEASYSDEEDRPVKRAATAARTLRARSARSKKAVVDSEDDE